MERLVMVCWLHACPGMCGSHTQRFGVMLVQKHWVPVPEGSGSLSHRNLVPAMYTNEETDTAACTRMPWEGAHG